MEQRDELLLHEITASLASATSLTRRFNDKWWRSPQSGEAIARNVGEMLMLQVSELAEAAEDSPQYNMAIMEITKSLARAMEGHRKAKMDDKIPTRPMVEVEMADAIIRIFDFCGGLGLDLAGAWQDKMLFNLTRPDHSHEARRAPGGKKY